MTHIIPLLIVSALLQAEPVPRPSNDAVAKVMAVASDLYGDRAAKARSPVERAALARELVRDAAKHKDDPASQFVLLYAARDLAANADDWPAVLEALTAIVARFQPSQQRSAEAQIKRGDRLCAAAVAKSALGRMRLQLEAAEGYLYAQRTGKGLQRELAGKRLGELLDSCSRNRNAKVKDLKVLLGTWEVTTTSGYHARWTFLADGTVVSTKGAPNGTWTATPDRVLIQWPKVSDTFHRPLAVSETKGITWKGHRILAHKAD